MSKEQKIPPDEKPDAEKVDSPISSEENKVAPVDEPTIISQPTVIPEKMEVHHHPDLHHRKKHLKEYLLEFLMIFLAVTLGFFAESLRETIADNNKEKEYIKSLISDLGEDIMVNETRMPLLDRSLAQLDSMVRILNDPQVRQFGSDLYFFGRQAGKIVIPFPINDRTIQQMKNSGGFRLIHNDSASSAINNYYSLLSLIEGFRTLDINFQNEYRRTAVDIFDPLVLETYINFETHVSLDSVTLQRPPGNPALLTYDSKQLIRFAGMVAYIRGTRLAYRTYEIRIRQNAQNLIDLLKREYHLDNK